MKQLEPVSEPLYRKSYKKLCNGMRSFLIQMRDLYSLLLTPRNSTEKIVLNQEADVRIFACRNRVLSHRK